MSALSDFLKNIPELKLNESKKKILLVFLLGISAVLIIYVYLFLKPSFAALADLIPKVRKYKTEIRALRNDLPFMDKFEEKKRLMREKLAGYEEKLSREKEIPALLESLSKLARTSRVKILGITPLTKRPVAQKKGVAGGGAIYEEVPISVSAQSGYHELGNFISRLENDKRFMRITDINIRANSSNPKRHEIKFVVYAYMFKGGR